MLDERSERAVAQIAAQARVVFGTDLVSLVLYGSAAGDDFVPGRSDLNFAIVLERVTFGHLQVLHQHLPKWHKLGATMPLLLDRRSLRRACDVFPMEFLDIKAQHRVLYGEEMFAALAIDPRHLRYQCEHEARSKLLRLQALYAEVGTDRRRLEALMRDSAKTFVLIMRNLLRLRGADDASRFDAIIDRGEREFGLQFPTLRHLICLRLGSDEWPRDVEETFRAYLDEIEHLVALSDASIPGGSERDTGNSRTDG